MSNRRKNLAGKRFGKLTVIEFYGTKPGSNKSMWKCECDCGKYVISRSDSLTGSIKTGVVKSCGCYTRRFLVPGNSKLSPREASLNYKINSYVQGAKRRGLKYELTKEDFIEITSKNCAYCNQSPSELIGYPRNTGNYHGNGIDRVDSNLGSIKSNCVPCCKICNTMKNALSVDEFFLHIKTIYEWSIK